MMSIHSIYECKTLAHVLAQIVRWGGRRTNPIRANACAHKTLETSETTQYSYNAIYELNFFITMSFFCYFRHYCKTVSHLLPKLLCSTNWGDRRCVAEIYLLLQSWPSLDPEVRLTVYTDHVIEELGELWFIPLIHRCDRPISIVSLNERP